MLCVACGGAEGKPSDSARAGAAPAFDPGGADPASAAGAADTASRPAAGRYRLARVRRPAQLRSTPGGRPLTRIGTRTEFGSRTVLNVVGRRPGWLRVVATQVPNGRRGWIPAASARTSSTDLAIHVDRSARRLTLRRGDRLLRRASVAVGRPGTPTPTGRFAVTDRLRPARADSPYGCCIIALTGHQTELVPGWPGGDRLAIHGTQQPETVGKPVSLGCMRARRRDVEWLMRRVPLGTPVFIRA